MLTRIQYPIRMAARGFTVIELALTLAIALILFSLLLPSLRPLLIRHRFDAVSRQVFSSLRFARQRAVSLAQAVSLCGSSDGVRCDRHWSRGLLVTDANGTVLRYVDLHENRLQLNWYSNLGNNQRLSWGADGYPFGQYGHFNLCDRQNHRAQTIVVARSGRLRSESTVC